VYLIDTNVVSEQRKRQKADPGVRAFFQQLQHSGDPAYLSTITIGELRRGVELIKHRGDAPQADLLAKWLDELLAEYAGMILTLDVEAAQVWGVLRVPHHENELDKQIAAIALVNDLTVVTRNTSHFASTGVRLLNPFSACGSS
jgi:predicted nucleic acid-binding protein